LKSFASNFADSQIGNRSLSFFLEALCSYRTQKANINAQAQFDNLIPTQNSQAAALLIERLKTQYQN